MYVLEVNGELQRERLNVWLRELGDVDEPLANDEDVHIGETDAESRQFVLQLLRAYRTTTENIHLSLRSI
ncbi:hypothetical protein F443_19918 [Phytophthora nicotianae P1569]|uniref:Uncharacterized protein n=1 Tax=Phytophthora nicotianae P1569 TaxID=1317065 RepID=V9E2T9_PHYNI|nr:hypothetical protein F443_19918 [Phytophthora nicotianae P1569]